MVTSQPSSHRRVPRSPPVSAAREGDPADRGGLGRSPPLRYKPERWGEEALASGIASAPTMESSMGRDGIPILKGGE